MSQSTGRTVLVVEDQDQVREMIVRALAGEGYHVLTARDGVDALEVLQSESDVSLVVTDIIMPRMDGFELAERLATWTPSPIILFMSGYGEHHTQAPSHSFLQKPFPPAVLCNEIQRLLAPAQHQA
jgi:two-component system, cell cycle sensor histidine kinase and response regulator CckA